MVERVAEMADAVVRHLQRLASRRDPSERPLVVRHPHQSGGRVSGLKSDAGGCCESALPRCTLS